MSQLVTNIQLLLKARNETTNAAAKASGINFSTLSRIISGDIASPRASTISLLAAHFGVDPEALAKGDAQDLLAASSSGLSAPIPLVTPKDTNEMALWLFDLPDSAFSEVRHYEKQVPIPPDDEIVNILGSGAKQVVAYRMEGAAMEPIFLDGDIVYVLVRGDDEKLPNGVYVLVHGTRAPKSSDGKDAILDTLKVRRLIRSEENAYVEALNTAIAPAGPILLSDESGIIGRVVGVYHKF